MDWTTGYTAEYYLSIVDPATWRDMERVEIANGNISRSLDGIMHTASIKCSEYSQSVEQWVRIWLNAYQNGASAHEALFTGLATTPAKQYDGVRNESSLTCYGVLKPAEDVLLLRGWYAAKGKNSGEVIKSLLSVTPAPVFIDGDAPPLTDYIIAGDNETALSMVQKIITAMGWKLRPTGNGEIHVTPPPIDGSVLFDPNGNDIIENNISVSQDLFSAPNVFAAISEGTTAVAKDESAGELSIRSRGREVWASDTGVNLTENETIERYAMRMLREAQNVQKTASYSRRFIPDLYPGDVINLNYRTQELTGLFEITSQNITLGFAARTNEGVKQWTQSVN